MDILRKFEDESLFRIQQFQEALEELSDEEYKLTMKKREADAKIMDLDDTLKKLREDKIEIENKIKVKQQFLNKELFHAQRSEEDSDDSENTNNGSLVEKKTAPSTTRENQLAALNNKENVPTSKMEEVLTAKISDVFR